MPVIDKYAMLNGAFTAARHIKAMASELDAQTGPIQFTSLSGRLDSMRSSYANGVQPLISMGTAAQVNPVIGTFFTGSIPADPYAQFQLVGTNLDALFVAYDAVFNSLIPIEYDPNIGHASAMVPLSQLATLSDDLAAVLSAVNPLA